MKRAANISKTAGLLILVNITLALAFAFLTVLLLTTGEAFKTSRSADQYLLIMIIVTASLTSGLISLRFRGMLVKSRNQSQSLENTIADMEKLSQKLKAQRHDFLNHLQVVYGLIEMDEYKDAGEYIEKVYNDIQKVSKVLKTSNLAINALIQAKMLTAEKKGITFEFNITTQLDNLPIPSWEFCRVLGNLIDNASDSLEGKEDSRVLGLQMSEDLKYYNIRISDNGPGIPESYRKRIFEPGFTTKGDKGEGMGLAITKEILSEYGGNIDVSSDPSLTVFEVTVPKR